MENFKEYFHRKLDEKQTINKKFSDMDGSWGGYYKGSRFIDDFEISDFGKEVNKINDLKINSFYIIKDNGMDVWQLQYKYMGLKNGKHFFKDTLQGSDNDLVFTEDELIDTIKFGDILNEK